MKLKIAKVIVSAFVALLVAQALQLSTPSAAAIIAILSVMDTKKVSLAATGQRLAAAVLALVIGMGIFAVFWIRRDEFWFVSSLLHSFSVSFKSGHRRGAEYRPCDSSLDAATTHFRTFCQ